MQPAKRGLLYSVQDVIVAIQNGESDFEMESDNTDASDKEADEDASEVDKKTNNPLTSQPMIIIEPQPNKHTMPCDKVLLAEKSHIFQWRRREDAADTAIKEKPTCYAASLMFIFTFQKKRSVFGTIIANEHGWTLGRRQNSVL